MKRFQNSIIFCISCYDPNINEIYVNSTTSYERWRYNFIRDYNKGSQDKAIYQVIRNNKGLSNWGWDILEYYPCQNKMQLESREFVWWNKLTQPVIPSNYRSICKAIDLIQATILKNEMYNNNFKALIEQVKMYGIIQYPQPSLDV